MGGGHYHVGKEGFIEYENEMFIWMAQMEWL